MGFEGCAKLWVADANCATVETWNFGLCATRSREPRQARKGATVPGKPSVPRRSRSSSLCGEVISCKSSVVRKERSDASDREAVGCRTEHIPQTSSCTPLSLIYTTSRLEFLPNRLVPARSGRRVRAPAQRPARGSSPRYGDITPARSVQAGGIA